MMSVLAFISAHAVDMLKALGMLVALASLVVGMLPMSTSKRSVVVRALAFMSAVVHSDAVGSLKMPMTPHVPGVAGVDVDAMLADFSLIEAAFKQAKAAASK